MIEIRSTGDSTTPPAESLPVGSRQSTLREANLRLVTRTALAAVEPLSRAAISTATGITRATVSRLVDELIVSGVLTELAQAVPSGRGRPATPVSAGRSLAALGLQVKADGLVGRVIALSGDVLAEHIEFSDLRGSEAGPVLARLGDISTRLIADTLGTRLVGVGLALPGIVSTNPDRLLIAPNLGWVDVAPQDHLPLAKRAHLPLRIGNEADYAALAITEVAPGRPGPLRDFFYLSGEAGIGGATVLDGKVMTGQHGRAGEIGHLTVDPYGPPCRCGSTGCLELYVGRFALLAAANLPSSATAHDLTARALAGEPVPIAALEARRVGPGHCVGWGDQSLGHPSDSDGRTPWGASRIPYSPTAAISAGKSAYVPLGKPPYRIRR